MKIEKTFTIAAPQQQVWEFITSPEQVAPCIPGCAGAEQTGPGTYKATITTRVGPVKATFHVDIETTEERPPEFAAYLTRGEEGSRASRLNAASALELKPLDTDQTEVTYTSEIKMMGRLGKFGAGVMTKVADSIGDQFVAELRKRIEGETPSTPTQEISAPATGASLRRWLVGGVLIAGTLIAWWLIR